MAENKKNFIFAVGKRKESVARLRLYTSIASLNLGDEKVTKGDIIVNGKKVHEYFGGSVSKAVYEKPLKAVNALGKYTVSIKVRGGGKEGQLEALVHAMARALSLVDEKNRGILKKQGLLTRDARVRERRKVGMGGKARRKMQSPKR